MSSTMVQDKHILHGQLEYTPTTSKTPSKLQRQEHPGLLLGVLEAADREGVIEQINGPPNPTSIA